MYKWTHTVQTYVVQRSTVYSKQKGKYQFKYSINNKIKSEWIKQSNHITSSTAPLFCPLPLQSLSFCSHWVVTVCFPPLDSELLISGDRQCGWACAEGTPVGQTWLAQPRFLLHNPPSPTTNGHGGMAGDQRAFIDGHSTTLPGLLHGRPSTSPFPTRTPIPAYCKAPSSTSVSWLCS